MKKYLQTVLGCLCLISAGFPRSKGKWNGSLPERDWRNDSEMNVLSLSDDESAAVIDRTIQSLQKATSTADAVKRIGSALSQYTVFDLQYIGGFIRREVNKLPNPYRRAYLPYSLDLLNQYHVFMQMYRTQKIYDEPIKDPTLWSEYWEIARVQCFVRSGPSDDPFPSIRAIG